ncbi:MAG: hypothetical protein R3209_06140 [Salinimicrobium sediminis]|nr:hypothetical protein [Salinimicrobium sediminis]
MGELTGVAIFDTDSKNKENMFEFDQYLGFIAFLVIGLLGFWVMVFLIGIIPYWIGGAVKEMLDEKKEKKRLEREKV